MIDFDQALKFVTATSYELGSEKVSMLDALNRVLAEDIHSDVDMPPFNKSAVDGYACRKADLRQPMKVVENIQAGQTPEHKIGPGECARIMTGATVPEGADTVIMLEDTEVPAEGIVRYLKADSKTNICFRGEDIKENSVVLARGTLLAPQHLAVMATAGCSQPRVYRKVRVAILSTGNELVEPVQIPGRSQMRNSNAYQLIGQVRKFGGVPDYIGIAQDDKEDLRKKITRALDGNDVLLISGGVSMGDYDLVPGMLEELGVDLKFRRVAVQPGKPVVFGTISRQFVFGLPGNPVASFVQFELLVKPLLYKLTGLDYQPVNLRLPIATDYSRKKPGKLAWLPITINDHGEAVPLEYHGSAHINALTDADGLISIPPGVTKIMKGELVHVRQI